MNNTYLLKILCSLGLTTILFFHIGCSNKKNDNDMKVAEQKLPVGELRSMQNINDEGIPKPRKTIKGFGPCDCNRKSQEIIDKTIAVRKKFATIEQLKSNKDSKKSIRELASEYNTLVAKCFEANAAALMGDNDCEITNGALQDKKFLLYSLGIYIDQGANIRL